MGFEPARPDDAADALLAEWERVVGSEEHRRRAHDVDQIAQGTGVVDRRIDVESVQIGAGRSGRPAAHDVPPMPGVLQPAQQEGERAAAVGEADAQVAREPVEGAAEALPRTP